LVQFISLRGIETLVLSHASEVSVPVSKISLPLLAGFTFMLLVEQLSSPHSHAHTPHTLPHHLHQSSEGNELETLGYTRSSPLALPETAADNHRAYHFTLGLLIHGLADGLALGVSALSSESKTSPDLSLIVFLALFIHKGAQLECMPCFFSRKLLHSANGTSFDDLPALYTLPLRV
jgi:zinc transporter 9